MVKNPIYMGARIPIIHKVYVKSRHLSRVLGKSPHFPTSQEVTEIASKFAGVERLKEAIEQLQLLLYSA
ncbi:MAG: hypothetical protein GPJ03_20300 [Microcystis aeruginosa G13-01]|nr:hypothetical protein [Microcystis aeruginosa G13-01]